MIDSCKNEHPGRNTTTNRNPFAPLQNNNRSNTSGQNNSNKGARSPDLPYHLDKDIISKDLTNERPLYILSAYGPGRDAPQQLFGDQPREQSFEELRLRHYELASAGNQHQAIQEAQTLFNNAEQQMQQTLSDLDGAIRYITDAANQHPNRLDICNVRVEDPSQPQQASGNAHSSTTGVAGSTPFGQPAFGKPAAPAFGQSSFGQSSAPAFGQSSFGQAAVPAPAFGQPSGLGQQPTVFGQPSNPSAPSAFGQTSIPAFGQAQQAPKPFGMQQSQQQPDFGQQNTALGQQPPSAPQTSGGFGQQPVQAPSNLFANIPSTSSAFGQPAPAPSNPFGQPTVPPVSNAFGKPAVPQQSTSAFGSQAPAPGLGTFGQHKQTEAPAPTGIFGKPPVQTTNDQAGQPTSTGIFGKPAAQTPSTQSATGMFGKPSVQTTSLGNIAAPTQPKQRPSTNARFGQDQTGNRILLSWQGQTVSYIDGDPCIKNSRDGGWQKVWFPEGRPTFTGKTQEYPEDYRIDDAAREGFKRFVEHEGASDGLIPAMPPPRNMINWNF